MTATATTRTTQRRRDANTLPRLLDTSRRVLSAIAAAWAGFRESGQLGADAEVSIGRHTGARI